MTVSKVILLFLWCELSQPLLVPNSPTSDLSGVERRLELLEQDNGLLRQQIQQNNNHMQQSDSLIQTLTAENTKVKSEIAELQRKDKSVAFFAYLHSDMVNIPDHATIIFADIVTNVGSHYDPTHGVFRAPVNGTYHFALVAAGPPSSAGSGIYLYITVNGQDESYLLLDTNGQTGETTWMEGSTVAVLHLHENDHVWVESIGTHPTSTLGGRYDRKSHTHFSGFLINVD